MYKGRSAGYVGWGFILIAAGAVATAFGLANPSESLYSGTSASPLTWVGGLVSLVGWAVLAFGAYTAASNLDYVALRAIQADQKARGDAASKPASN